MFDTLSDKIQNAMHKFSTSTKLSEEDIKEPLKDIRRALLEADVNFKVTKDFVEIVRKKALEQFKDNEVTARNKLMRIVSEELQKLLGGSETKLNINPKPPTVIMLVGLQGAGKTTTAGKLAYFLKRRKNKKPLLVAADIYRPAAVKQLEVLAEQTECNFFAMEKEGSPVDIAVEGISKAKHLGCDTVIIDTAGRLHIDVKLMEELKNIKELTCPDEIMLVVDGMTGQEAVTVASSFDETLGITGLVFTKLDGDTRGGAVLSIRSVTGKPIKLIGTGERLEAIEEFHPDRMASRILGMGDLATFTETIAENFKGNGAQDANHNTSKENIDLEDFLNYIKKIKKMGSMKSLLKMLPGMKNDFLDNINENELQQVEAIIHSMTPKERRNPNIIKYSRKKRIAKGCGKNVQDINKILKSFEEMKKTMKTMKLLKGKGKFFNKTGMKLPL